MMTEQDADQLLTIVEVASILRVHRRTVEKWIRHNRLSAVRLAPTAIRVDSAELRSFIDQHRTSTTHGILDQALAILNRRHIVEELCTRCGERPQQTEAGWCRHCTDARERELESKRKWWAAHGVEAKQRQREKRQAHTKEQA